PHHISLTHLSATPPATTNIHTLSLHDALPIFEQTINPALGVGTCAPGRGITGLRRVQQAGAVASGAELAVDFFAAACRTTGRRRDRKSTRLNSSHVKISYAVFCLKKKKKNNNS